MQAVYKKIATPHKLGASDDTQWNLQRKRLRVPYREKARPTLYRTIMTLTYNN